MVAVAVAVAVPGRRTVPVKKSKTCICIPFPSIPNALCGICEDGWWEKVTLVRSRSGILYEYISGVIKVNPQSLGGLQIKRIADYERTLRSLSRFGDFAS